MRASCGRGRPIGGDDRFFVHIDPFNNRRSGYLFGVNPNGVRFDGVFEGVTQRQFDWDGIWQAPKRDRRAKAGSLEIAIPFKTLSFDPSTETLAHELRRATSSARTKAWRGTRAIATPTCARWAR